jgi:hypothetical protein
MRGRGRLFVGRSRGLIAAVAVVFAAAVAAVSASLGGAASQKTVPVASADNAAPAASIADLVSQVQSGFGDGLIQSASADGTTLNVTVAPAGDASATVADFEAAVLAHAVADWQSAHGQSPVVSFSEVTPDGRSASGLPTVLVGSDSSADSLTSGTCESAAENTPTSVTVVSAATLPYAGGTCVLKVQTSDSPDAALNAVANGMSSVIPQLRNYPYLIEAQDLNGVPQVILTWVPGSGDGHGEGSAYVRPGVSAAVHG